MFNTPPADIPHAEQSQVAQAPTVQDSAPIIQEVPYVSFEDACVRMGLQQSYLGEYITSKNMQLWMRSRDLNCFDTISVTKLSLDLRTTSMHKQELPLEEWFCFAYRCAERKKRFNIDLQDLDFLFSFLDGIKDREIIKEIYLYKTKNSQTDPGELYLNFNKKTFKCTDPTRMQAVKNFKSVYLRKLDIEFESSFKN